MTPIKSLYIPPEKIISNMIKNGRLAHSFLLVGPQGSKKTEKAIELSKILLCQNRIKKNDSLTYCDKCSSCRKVNNFLHPDMHIIRPEDGAIKINQIREIKRTLSLKPLTGKNRLCIISHAETMRIEASNALLKMLEEPPNEAYIFLTSPNPSLLIPTIVSRAIILRCKPKDFSQLCNLLKGEIPNLVPGLYNLSINLSEGDIERAKEFLSEDFLIWRKRLFNYLAQEKVKVRELFSLTEYMSQDQNIFNNCIELLKSWARDILLFNKHEGCPKILNLDLLDLIQAGSKLYDPPKIYKFISHLDFATVVILRNINLSLYAESLLIRLKN